MFVSFTFIFVSVKEQLSQTDPTALRHNIPMRILTLVAALSVTSLFAEDTPPPNERKPVTPTQAAAKASQIVNSLGMKFTTVLIPGGKPILFSVWETRVRDFDAFVKATGHDATSGMISFDAAGNRVAHGKNWQSPGFAQTPEHPITGVNLEDAGAFCQWLSKREGKKYRLPTDHEWSCAVGIGEREQMNELPIDKLKKNHGIYPWGTQWPPPDGSGNFAGEECKGVPGFPPTYPFIVGYRDKYVFTAPVGTFRPNQFGIYDLPGNVSEWCVGDFDGSGKFKMARGGSWFVGMAGAMGSSIRGRTENQRTSATGFRCVIDAD